MVRLRKIRRRTTTFPGVPLAKPELVKAIRARNLKSASAVFDALTDGRDDPASKPGLASLLRTVWGADYEDERDARFINDRVHANIQKDGTFSVIPRIYGGVTSPAQLRRVAEVAENYHVRMVKITGGQRIDLLGVRKADLPAIWPDLGMPSGHAYTKALPDVQNLCRERFLPLWRWRFDHTGNRHRNPLSEHREPGKDETWCQRMSAQLC